MQAPVGFDTSSFVDPWESQKAAGDSSDILGFIDPWSDESGIDLIPASPNNLGDSIPVLEAGATDAADRQPAGLSTGVKEQRRVKDFGTAFKEWASDPLRVVPFAHNAPEIAELWDVYQAAQRGDVNRVYEWQQKQDEEAKADKTFGYHVVDIVSRLPAFSGEFMMTGSAYTLGKQAAVHGLKKMLKNTAQEAAEKKLRYRAATGAVGALAQTPFAQVTTIGAETLRGMIPGLELTEDEQGQVNAVLSDQKDGFAEAFFKAFGRSYIEVFSERTGGPISDVFAKLPGVKKLAALKSSVFKHVAGKMENPTAAKIFDYIKTRGGWHGAIPEFMEERFGEAARYLTGLDENYTPVEQAKRGELLEQWGAELVALAVPGVVRGAVSRLNGKSTPKEGTPKSGPSGSRPSGGPPSGFTPTHTYNGIPVQADPENPGAFRYAGGETEFLGADEVTPIQQDDTETAFGRMADQRQRIEAELSGETGTTPGLMGGLTRQGLLMPTPATESIGTIPVPLQDEAQKPATLVPMPLHVMGTIRNRFVLPDQQTNTLPAPLPAVAAQQASRTMAGLTPEGTPKPTGADLGVAVPGTPARQDTPTPSQPAPDGAALGGPRTTEVPVADLKLSGDVPQFKLGADNRGIVEPLGGKYERTGTAPILVWRRKNGDLEVISGRHRLELARRTGEQTIPAQILDEAEGFDRKRAAILDAELNIRDNQGKVADYVQYFQGTGITEKEADARGLLARATGRRAYGLSNQGDSELIAAHRNGLVSDEAAVQIAAAAPKNGRLQTIGIKAIRDGKSTETAVNLIRAVQSLAGDKAESLDLFGFDASAMREAEEMAAIASRKQREIAERHAAISNAAKRPELAKREGVDVKNPASVLRRAKELREERSAWENWHTNPSLTAQIRAAMTPKPVAAQVEPTEQPKTGDFRLDAIAESDLPARQKAVEQKQERQAQVEREAEERAKAEKSADSFVLTRDDSDQAEAEARGQRALELPTAVTAVDEAAHQAATSPLNDQAEPTEKQKESGRYQKGHTSIGGFAVDIENPEGSKRRPEWPPLRAHYGYFPDIKGKDKDRLDVFVKPGTPEDYSGAFFVVDQVNPETGRFDEHKVMAGWDNAIQAAKAYRDNYSKDWNGLKSITRMMQDEFREWTKSGRVTEEAAKWKKEQRDRTTAKSGEVSSSVAGADAPRAQTVTAPSQGEASHKAPGTEPEPHDTVYPLAVGSVFDRWRRVASLHAEPDAHQRRLIDAVARVVDRGLFYNSDVYPAVKKELGDYFPHDVREGVGKGGTEIYMARRTLDAERSDAAVKDAMRRLGIRAGQNLGQLVFNDGKRTSSVVVTAIHDGHAIELTGKRGPATLKVRTDAVGLERAIHRSIKEGGKVLWSAEKATSAPQQSGSAETKSDQRTTAPVAESQAPVTSEPGEGGVAFVPTAGNWILQTPTGIPVAELRPADLSQAGRDYRTFELVRWSANDGGEIPYARNGLTYRKWFESRMDTTLKLRTGAVSRTSPTGFIQTTAADAPFLVEGGMASAQANTAPGPLQIGQLVKLQIPGVGGPINVAGTIRRFVAGNKAEVKTQNHGYYTVPRSELMSANPRDVYRAPVRPQKEAISDVGEKVGGARKDLADKTGPRGTREKSEVSGWRKRYEVSQIVKGDGEGRWVIRDARSKDWQGQPRQIGRDTFATREEAEAAVPLVAVSRNHRAVPVNGKWEIWRDVADRKRVKVVDRQFDSRDDAMRYMARNAEQIIETKTSFGEEILPIPDTVTREGPARRTGNVTGEDFMNSFGLRAVEFGLWENQEERQQVMNHAYDALADLAEVLNIPPRAIGLNGELALAFGARGHGLTGARAHYERDYGVINLTKMKGAGSLAHEWLHAADHYFGRQDTKAGSEKVKNERGDLVYPAKGRREDYVSHGFSRESGVREALRQAYQNVMDTLSTKAEKYVEDTQKADKFVAEARNDLANALNKIRADLASDLTKGQYGKYYEGKRNTKPATAEQLAEFDAIAEKLVAGEFLETDYRLNEPRQKFRRMVASGRWTNDALDKLSAIYKVVRGRSGFSDKGGIIVDLTGPMKRYSTRLKMLAEAQSGTEKTKKLPTAFAMEAKSIDQGRGEAYWATPHEMAARAFQAYVEDKIAEKGGKSDFLTYGTNKAVPTPWGWKRPFPQGEERQAINAAFDRLVGELKTRETDRGVAMFSRSHRENLLDGWKRLASFDEAFQQPTSSKTDLRGIAQDIDPGIKVEDQTTENKDKSIKRKWRVVMPDHRVATVYERVDGRVYLNALPLKSGESRGTALYNVVATYAHNNGKVFIGDTLGLSDEAVYRRLENLISSALRFRTTKHIMPHPVQMRRLKFDWTPGDHDGNLARMLMASYNAITAKVPEIKQIVYDFDANTFRNLRDGRPVTDADFKALRDSGGAKEIRAGSATLKRAAYTNTLVRGAGEEVRQGDVGPDIRELLQGVADTPLRKILYSLKQPRPDAGVSASGVDHAKARAVVQAIAAKWANAPKIVVARNMDDPAVPEPARQAAQASNAAQSARGAFGEPEGVYHNGTVYLLSDSIQRRPVGKRSETEAEAVIRVLAHEALGHAGLRGFFGKDLERILRQIIVSRNADVRRKAAEYGLDMASENGRLNAAEEFLAEMAQTQPTNGFVKRAIEAIRKALRRMIQSLPMDLRGTAISRWANELTDAEIINDYLLPARRFIEGGTTTAESWQPTQGQGVLGQAMASRAVTDEEAEALVREYAAVEGAPTPAEIREAVRQFRETEKAYGGQEAYEKAKADGRTKLTYGQWVQVRTPNFKTWFGDFNQTRQADVPAVYLTGEEIAGSTPTEARQNAREYIRKMIAALVAETGTDRITNQRTGQEIKLTETGAKHGFAHRGESQVKAVAAMREMLSTSAKIAQRRHEPKSAEYPWVHTYVFPLNLAGRWYAVKLTVKESWKGEVRLYDHEALEMETPDGISGSTPSEEGSIHRPASGGEVSVAHLLTAFKGKNVKYLASKVVDPDTGEPMVVYHGSDESRTVFDTAHGTYFSADEARARRYAAARTGFQQDGKLTAAFLDIRNPETFDSTDDAAFEAFTDRRESSDAVTGRGYDGQILQFTEPNDNDFRVNEANQVKSARDNIGTFDPTKSDTRFSRQRAPSHTTSEPHPSSFRSIKQKAAGYIEDQFTKTGHLNWWDKSVGTMRNIAKKNKYFAKVYRELDAFANDTSMFAIEVEKAAPWIFRRLDSLKTAISTGHASDADLKVVGDAIFDGTLEGKVLRAADMRARGFTKRQMSMYRQALDTVNKSLYDLARTTMVRMARNVGLDRALVEGVYDDSRTPEEMRTGIRTLIDPMISEAKTDLVMVEQAESSLTKDYELAKRDEVDSRGKEAAKKNLEVTRRRIEKLNRLIATLENTRQNIDEVAVKTEKLRTQGYFPLMRFGRHTVDVLDANGERAYFGMFDTRFQAARMARLMREAYPDGTVSLGQMNPDAWRMYKGITPDTLELFADSLGVDKEGVFQEYLRLATNNRSALKRLIHRKGIPGFSEDLRRVLAAFVLSNARASSNNLHSYDAATAIQNIPKEQGDVQQKAQALMDYMQSPREEFAGLRQFLFFDFLGGSVASALTNMTQVPMVTVPYLSQFSAKAPVIVGKWLRGQAPKNAAHRAALDRASEEGVVSPQEVFNLMATARGGSFGTHRIMQSRPVQTALYAWGAMFSLAEQYNRTVTFNAAYDLAVQKGMSDPYSFAKEAVEETQFVYQRHNRPTWARGIGSPLFTFKQFTINYLEFLHRLPAGQKVLAIALLVLAAGLEGLPFEDDLEDLVDAIAQWSGVPWNTRKELDKWALDTMGHTFGNLMLHGVSGLDGFPFDVQGRLGLGNLIPMTGALKPANPDRSRDATEFFGAAGSVVRSAFEAAERSTKGQIGQAVYLIMPRAIQSAVKGIEAFQTGRYTDIDGRLVNEVTPQEALLKIVGLQPASTARIQRAKQMIMEESAFHRMKEDAFADNIAYAKFHNDGAAMLRARKELFEWNREHPDSRIEITQRQITSRVDAMRKTAKERTLRSVPKELRESASGYF